MHSESRIEPTVNPKIFDTEEVDPKFISDFLGYPLESLANNDENFTSQIKITYHPSIFTLIRFRAPERLIFIANAFEQEGHIVSNTKSDGVINQAAIISNKYHLL